MGVGCTTRLELASSLGTLTLGRIVQHDLDDVVVFHLHPVGAEAQMVVRAVRRPMTDVAELGILVDYQLGLDQQREGGRHEADHVRSTDRVKALPDSCKERMEGCIPFNCCAWAVCGRLGCARPKLQLWALVYQSGLLRLSDMMVSPREGCKKIITLRFLRLR